MTRTKKALIFDKVACAVYRPSARINGRDGGFPHCGCQSPPLFVFLASPRGQFLQRCMPRSSDENSVRPSVKRVNYDDKTEERSVHTIRKII